MSFDWISYKDSVSSPQKVYFSTLLWIICTWVGGLLHAPGLLLVLFSRFSVKAALWSSREAVRLTRSRRPKESSRLWRLSCAALVLVQLAPGAWRRCVTAGSADAKVPCDALSSVMCNLAAHWRPQDCTTMVKEMWFERTRMGVGGSTDASLRTDPKWIRQLYSAGFLKKHNN